MKRLLLCMIFSACFATAYADEFRAESTLQNDDGSVTVRKPTYATQDGNEFPVSAGLSNPSGVCRAFGFGKSIFETDKKSGAGRFAVVAMTGKLEKTASRKDVKEYDAPKTAIFEIVCTLDASTSLAKVSDDAKEVSSLTYGTARIVEPRFGTIGGKKHAFSEHTNLTGLCRLYGYDLVLNESSVEFTKSLDGAGKGNVILSRDGLFNGIDSEGVVKSIVCQGELLYKISSNFYPQGLNKTLEGIAFGVKPMVAGFLRTINVKLQQLAPTTPSDSRVLKDSTKADNQDWLRMLELELLKPVFESLSSEWFDSTVRPSLNEQVTALHKNYDYQRAGDLVKHTTSIELVVANMVAAIDAVKNNVASLEAQEWLAQLKGKAGLLLAVSNIQNINRGSQVLKDLLTVWDQGDTYYAQMLSNFEIVGLANSMALSAELLKGLQ